MSKIPKLHWIGGLVLALIVCHFAALSFSKWIRQPSEGAGSVKVVATKNPPAPREVGHPSFLSPHASPIKYHDGRVFIANTPADTVDVVDTKTGEVVARVPVGIDPVSVAVRPDGREVWVANHVSDSVSVIDADPDSPTHLHVVGTVQDIDLKSRSTRFDEPVGIAFASETKAYVALSSENQIAVVDVATRKVTRKLKIPSQDPRAIRVHGDRLYVTPFESNNQTQLSGGTDDEFDGDLDTFNAHEHSIANNNVLSLGHVLDIIKHPKVPDRDLYIFDTGTDQLVQTVDTLGTLLYGMAVDSEGRVFIAQTDARNDANGGAGTKKHGLAELGNRAFLNRITRVDPAAGLGPRFFDLEPLPPKDPAPGKALSTPYAVEVLPGDRTLVATAAGSDQVFTLDAQSGELLGRVKVGAVPRGIALESKHRAWILNAVDNSVSLVKLDNVRQPEVVGTIQLEDPTHPAQKAGRILFESAVSSTTESFSCASCHPDGHTDQLLWVLKTPIVSKGTQIQPRSTMPLRGLRETAPFHWDGIPGDPYGGTNSASVREPVEPNAKLGDPISQTRHLVDAGLATTMARVGGEGHNDVGQLGRLSAAERHTLSKFLLDIPYPPAQRRAYTNVLSERAQNGFDLFHLQGNREPDKPGGINVCGDCHRMPFLVSTNTPGSGMDAPTWRGAYDRWLILPQGRLNLIDFDFFRRIADAGLDERSMWRLSWLGKERFDPVWDMVLEMATGYSGAFGRQVTLNKNTVEDELVADLIPALESAAASAGVVLQVEGVFLTDPADPLPTVLQFEATHRGGMYLEISGTRRAIKRGRLLELARTGQFVGTFTGRHGARAGYDEPPPALWTRGTLHAQVGRQEFPVARPGQLALPMSGRHVRADATIHVDGSRVPGKVQLQSDEQLVVVLAHLPEGNGLHFLQVQNPGGRFSNDMMFQVADAAEDADLTRPLADAISAADAEKVKRLLDEGASPRARHPDTGSTPLSRAAFHGHLEIARLLLKEGAEVGATNQDGNTALHVAAFLCRTEIVDLLLEHGAGQQVRNQRGERPIDTVTGAWSAELADFYRVLDRAGNLGLDIEAMKSRRNQMVQQLRKERK